jgi:branched-chain amino acid transport system ATP-binding protein
MAGPSLLLADELSLGLAPVIADEVASRLVALKATRIGVVVVDQDIVRCRETSDRMYFIYGGTTSGGGHADGYQIDELPLWGPPGSETPGASAVSQVKPMEPL